MNAEFHWHMLVATSPAWMQSFFKGFLKQDVTEIIKRDVVISRPLQKKKLSAAFSISFAVESVELKLITHSIVDAFASKIFRSCFFPFP